MKKIMMTLMAAIVAAASCYAQYDPVALAKQQQKLHKVQREMLDEKPSKSANSEAKKLIKEGWRVQAGSKDIAHQITDVQYLSTEVMADEAGNPTSRYIVQQGNSTAGTLNVGRNAARANAIAEVAQNMETKVAAALQLKLDNQQNTSITTTTVEKFHERVKAVTDACLTNLLSPLTIYRELPNHNYQVQVTVAFDRKELTARLKRELQKQLEMEGNEELNDIVDEVIKNW